MAYYVYFVFLFFSWVLFSEFGCARNNISTTQSLRDPDTLESSDGSFKFGFFSLINSTDRYVGIWYNKKVRDTLEVIWIANRKNPLNDSSGVIKISGDGNLQVLDGQNKSIWSSNVTAAAPKNEINNSCVAQLQDDGNLVLLTDASGDNVIWQSFDHLTDSLLHHMKLRFDENRTATTPLIASWKSASDPSIGRFTAGFNHRRLPEIFVWDSDLPYWRSGPWYGNMFLGVRAMYYFAEDDGFHIENDNNGTLSLSFSSTSRTVTEHYVLNYDGLLLKKYYLEADGGDWLSLWRSLESDCDIYGKCGEFGSCNIKNLPICSCLPGFEPRNNQEWSAGNWSSGCILKTPLQCGTAGGEEDGFSRLRNTKVPDNAMWLYSEDDGDCRQKCLENCTCLAYAYYFGLGCMIWNDNLIDIQEFSSVGVDLFIRLAHSEIAKNSEQQQGKARKTKITHAVMAMIGMATVVVIVYCVWRWMCQRNGVTTLMRIMVKKTLFQHSMPKDGTTKVEVGDLPVFGLEKLAIATNHFQDINKLGQGGFGVVYKGKLDDGQEIAVKRLSKASGQGLKEFMTEVLVISKLQHRNLVKLLGCCIQGEEKMLVYEYMPNKSLDALLFDPTYQKMDWKRRFNVILGICRGLLYLHRDSRLRIIHRDLKASNILLDGNLNPKISDFGMARIFGGNQDQGDTKRIVGTYGYMSPEYAMEGRFSEKSDVFSLGVLLLEIVSGRRNNCFKEEDSLSLLGHAWKLWNEGNILSLIDPAISESTFHAEILKCVQLGLLCVQEFPDDRPSVSMILSMIESEVTDLPCPSQPGFTQRGITSYYKAQLNDHENGSVNHVSITALSGR